MAQREKAQFEDPTLEPMGDKENQSTIRNTLSRPGRTKNSTLQARKLQHWGAIQKPEQLQQQEEDDVDARFALSLSQVQIRALQDENNRWRTRVKEIKTEKENLEEIVAKLQYALTSTETKLADARDEMDDLGDLVMQLKFSLAQSESECQELKEGAGFASLFDKCASQRSISCQTTERDFQESALAAKEDVVYVTESFEMVGSGMSVLDDLNPEARRDIMQHYLNLRNGETSSDVFSSSALQLGAVVNESCSPRETEQFSTPAKLHIEDYESEFDDDASFGDFKTPKSSGRHMSYDDFSSDDEAQLL